MGYIRSRNEVQMGGRCTRLYIHPNKNGTRVYSNIVTDGTRLYSKLREKYNRLCAREEKTAIKRCLFVGIYTRMGAFRGLRDLPDKCVCDTNAYLARNSKVLLHPMGCSIYSDQDGKGYLQARRRIRVPRGIAYD